MHSNDMFDVPSKFPDHFGILDLTGTLPINPCPLFDRTHALPRTTIHHTGMDEYVCTCIDADIDDMCIYIYIFIYTCMYVYIQM